MMETRKSNIRSYYTDTDKACPNLARHSRNLTLLSLEGRLEHCYHRESTIRQIQKLLLRKNKANILLTGPAGCGKTALAEGLAEVVAQSRVEYIRACLVQERMYKKAMKKWEENGMVGQAPILSEPAKPPLCECVIYDLSLSSLVGGTKYRGEFEERVEMIIGECKKNPNVILFVDEIHLICNAGAAEGAISAGQILKPALARGDVRMIGATTTEEREEIRKDKALARRFTELEIQELQADAAQQVAEKVLEDYCAYHNVQAAVSPEHLLAYVRSHLPDTVFPDNYINVVDETLAGAVLDGLSAVNMQHFAQTLSRMTGHIILCMDEPEANLAS